MLKNIFALSSMNFVRTFCLIKKVPTCLPLRLPARRQAGKIKASFYALLRNFLFSQMSPIKAISG
jgi:hypothetical protein